jgi:hypothetical protein
MAKTNKTSKIKNKVSSPSMVTLATGPYGSQEYIQIGATPNDGNGDPLRVAFGKINNNFSNLFFTTTTTSTAYTEGLDANQVIFEAPVNEFYQGKFQIRSCDATNIDMQDITLSASITNNLGGVKFSGYSTLFQGNAICRYDMDVSAGNVRVLINPIANANLEHFISAIITYPNVEVTGMSLQLDGYADGNVMSTQSNLMITTQQS